MKISDLPECYRKQAKEKYDKAKVDHRDSGSPSDQKRAVRHEPLEAETVTRFNGQVSITVRTTRRRDTDNRALEDKYFTDALVTAKILRDDKKKYVSKLDVPEPEIGTDEKTIIEIEEVEG